jgi:hypothetical protein
MQSPGLQRQNTSTSGNVLAFWNKRNSGNTQAGQLLSAALSFAENVTGALAESNFHREILCDEIAARISCIQTAFLKVLQRSGRVDVRATLACERGAGQGMLQKKETGKNCPGPFA